MPDVIRCVVQHPASIAGARTPVFDHDGQREGNSGRAA